MFKQVKGWLKSDPAAFVVYSIALGAIGFATGAIAL